RERERESARLGSQYRALSPSSPLASAGLPRRASPTRDRRRWWFLRPAPPQPPHPLSSPPPPPPSPPPLPPPRCWQRRTIARASRADGCSAAAVPHAQRRSRRWPRRRTLP